MAGSSVVTRDYDDRTGIDKITWTWTSDGSGDCDCDAVKVKGEIKRVVTNPSATAPTDDYDIVINDEDGVDVMAGGLANRDTANTEQVIPDPPILVQGNLSPVVSNAGAAKTGALVLYVKK